MTTSNVTNFKEVLESKNAELDQAKKAEISELLEKISNLSYEITKILTHAGEEISSDEDLQEFLDMSEVISNGNIGTVISK